jgi:hypothetical protein
MNSWRRHAARRMSLLFATVEVEFDGSTDKTAGSGLGCGLAPLQLGVGEARNFNRDGHATAPGY